MDVDHRNRNCYNYREFGHLARNCKNKGIENKIGQGRRLEYGGVNNRQRLIEEGQNNLNGDRDLIVLN